MSNHKHPFVVALPKELYGGDNVPGYCDISKIGLTCSSTKGGAISHYLYRVIKPYAKVLLSNLEKNSDGSVDLYFGPKAPKGKEKNWMQTVENKGWFTILRIYSFFLSLS